MEKYKIILADGTELADLSKNGGNFISKTEVKAETFEYNCSPVTISDGETEIVHPNMKLCQITNQAKGEWWFVLEDISDEKIERDTLSANVEYLAMMLGIDLQ